MSRHPSRRALAALGLAAVCLSAFERTAPAAQRTASDEIRYVEAGSWPLDPQSGPSWWPFAANDVAWADGGRLLVADEHTRAVFAVNPETREREIWPTDLSDHDPCSVTPIRVVALQRSPAVVVIWRVDAPGRSGIDHIAEVRRPDGTIVRRLPFKVFNAAEDRSNGDVWFHTDRGLRRSTWPDFELGAVARLDRSVSGGTGPWFAVAAGRIGLWWDGHLRLYDAATGRIAAVTRLEPSCLPVRAAAGGDHFWVLCASADGSAHVQRFDWSGVHTATWTAADLAIEGLNAGSPSVLDVRLEGDAGPAIVIQLAERRHVLRWFRGCPIGGGRCAAANVVEGGDVTLGRTPCRPASIQRTLIAGTADGGLIAHLGSHGQLLLLDADGRAKWAAQVTDVVLDVAADGAGGALVALQPRGSDPGVEIARYAAAAVGEPLVLAWRVRCAACPPSVQLAGDGREAFVTHTARRSVARLDLATGEGLGILPAPATAAGLWPADVAVTADGTLWTADAPSNSIQGWSAPSRTLTARWPAGFRSVPLRLATGTAANGAPLVAVQRADGGIDVHLADGNVLAGFDPRRFGVGRVGAHAVGPAARIYVLDADAGAIRLFDPERVPFDPESTATVPAPTPTPAPEACVVRGDKTAGPGRIVLGETATVTLSLAAECPARSTASGADLVLAIDRSTSMIGHKFDDAIASAVDFVTYLDLRVHRVGLVTFSDTASLDIGLSPDAGRVVDALLSARIAQGDGPTDIAAGVAAADAELAGTARTDALPVIVLLTDGQADRASALAKAAQARSRGVRLYTIGLGDDADAELLREMAAGRYFAAPTTAELFPIYAEILRLVSTSLSGELTIDDTMGDDVRYVAGSSAPAAIEQGEVLRWSRSILSPEGITLTYRVRPLRVGRLPTNREAMAHYTDADGARRSYIFPVPFIDVVAPTPTPTATATPPPPAIYLPLALAERCTPAQRRVDVALVLDASTSMAEPAGGGAPGTKLDAARAAARRFVGALRLELGDQAAVIAFNRRATVLVGLSGDRTAIDRGLNALALDGLTRPHLGLAAAADELASPRHRPANARVIVLLTDGRANPDPPSLAVARAQAAKAAGIVVFTVALGGDVDADALRTMATAPEFFFTAVDGAALGGIFSRIAGSIPCPAAAFWGGR